MSFASDFYKHCRESRLAGAQVSVFSGADYQLDLAYGMASLEDVYKRQHYGRVRALPDRFIGRDGNERLFGFHRLR